MNDDPNYNPPAFPKASLDPWGKSVPREMGMTLRDYIAANAIGSCAAYALGLVRNKECTAEAGLAMAVKTAFNLADAMLQSREKDRVAKKGKRP